MPCLTHDDLGDFLADRLPVETRAHAEQHLSDCPACRRRLVALYGAERAEDSTSSVATTGSPAIAPQVTDELLQRARAIGRRAQADRRTPASYGRLAAAAAVVVAIGLAGTQLTLRRPSPVPQPADTLRSSSVSEEDFRALDPPDGADIVAADTTLRWTAMEGARGYTVTLLDDLGDIVHQASTDGARWELPNAATLPLNAGASYYWFVTVRLDDGTTLETDLRRWRPIVDP